MAEIYDIILKEHGDRLHRVEETCGNVDKAIEVLAERFEAMIREQNQTNKKIDHLSEQTNRQIAEISAICKTFDKALNTSFGGAKGVLFAFSGIVGLIGFMWMMINIGDWFATHFINQFPPRGTQ